MGFNGLLKANFLGPGPYEKKVKYRWELSEALSFTWEGTDEEYEILKEMGLTKTKNLRSRKVKGVRTITLTCNEGFITDLASIPRGAWVVISPWDIARAAVIHDLLYQTLRRVDVADWQVSRKVCDDIFKKGMEAAEPPAAPWKISVCYNSVRMFGGMTFNK